MGYTWQERFILWLCRVFGHKPDINHQWEYEGLNSVCKRCRKCIKKKDKWV